MDDSEIIFNNRISDSLIEFDQDMSCPSNLMDMHVVDEVTCTPSASASTPNYSNVERLMQNKFDDFLHQIDQMFKNTKEEMQHMTNKAMDKVDRDIAALRAQVTPPHVPSLGSGDQTHVTRNSSVDFDQRITDCNGSTFNPHMQGEGTCQYLEQATSSNNMFSTQNVLFNNNNNDNLATANRWSGPSTLAPGVSSLAAGRSNSGVRTPHQNQTSKSNINGSIKMKPQYYDGTEDLDDYLSQFEILAELNAWNYVTKSLYLAGSLKGDARTLLSELSPMERKDYQSLVQILNLRFGSMNRAEIFKANLQTRVKRKEESISELAQSIKKLTRQAYPNAPPALIFTLAKDHFIDALPESDMRLRIREAQSKDIAEAEILALQLEAYRVADKQKTNRYRGHPINAVATNESACLDDPESFTKTFMDGFRQEMKSLTNDIKQVVKSAQSSQPGKTNDNYSNNKQWSNNYQNKGNYQNRNNNNGSGNNNRNNSYNGQTNNNSRNQNGRNDQNGNTAQNYGQGYSGNRDLSNTGAGVRQMSQGPG